MKAGQPGGDAHGRRGNSLSWRLRGAGHSDMSLTHFDSKGPGLRSGFGLGLIGVQGLG